MPRADATLTSVQMAVLGFLVPGPKHGYELYQDFTADLGQIWRLGRSKLYAELKHAEDRGWVYVETELQPSRPPRKVYHLTDAGREVFLQWVQEPTTQLRRIRIELLARLYFYHRHRLDGQQEFIDRQKKVLKTRIKSLSSKAHQPGNEFWHSVLLFRKGQLEAVIEWLDNYPDNQ